MCAFMSITEKVLGSSNTDERKILVDDVNQIRQVIQTGEKDLKTKNVSLLGNTITADNGAKWIRRYGNTFQFYNGSSWQEPSTATLLTFTAGENIAARDVVYLKVSDGKIYKASTSNSDWIGVATSAITSGASGTVYPNGSLVGGFSSLTVGSWYDVGNTPGAIIQSSGLNRNTVGIAISATQIKITKQSGLDIPLYSILYNRMEQDTNPTFYSSWGYCTGVWSNVVFKQSQIDTNIQSDVFGENRYAPYFNSCNPANWECYPSEVGKYCTICKSDTNSFFCNKWYANLNEVYNFCYNSFCDTCTCCDYTGTTNIIESITDNKLTCVGVGGQQICCAKCGYLSYNRTANLDFSDNYYMITANINSLLSVANNCSICYVVGLKCIAFNNDVSCCCLCMTYVSGISSCHTNQYKLIRNSNNCFDFLIDDNCICSQLTSLPISFMICACNRLIAPYNNVSTALSFVRVYHEIIGYKIQETVVNTNIKNYATPKNAVMLVTNSVLPAGNCVRYDIKNQAGCTYLSDAEPDKVYNLCTNDSCCFYAVIKQCVECNLCDPQCMYGYALKMM